MKSIFLDKSCTKFGAEASPRFFSKKSKLIYLWIGSLKCYTACLYCMSKSRSKIPCWPYYTGPFNVSLYRRYFSNVNGQALIDKHITPALLTPYHEK